MTKIFLCWLTTLCLSSSFANYDENSLRTDLFTNYKKEIIPKETMDDPIVVVMGVGIQNLESFNQMEETLELNMWVRLNWIDESLQWNSSVSNISFLSVGTHSIWVPDIELLNAASLPQIYTLRGGINLYNNGLLMWSNPAIFRFSCALELHNFPFDTQTCVMKFSSWVYDNSLLYLIPNPIKEKQIDVLSSFSHSEWKILDVYLDTYNETRECCGDNTFSVNKYTFSLKRYPHYYKLSMGMTISLVIVSFIIMLVKPTNISRTSTAVFIPLTILALQLTLADKIPVVGYYTLMDKFFLCCFITSMLVSIESGIVYVIITSKSHVIYKLFHKFYDFKKLYDKENQYTIDLQKRMLKHNTYMNKIINPNESNTNDINPNESNTDDIQPSESNTDDIQPSDTNDTNDIPLEEIDDTNDINDIPLEETDETNDPNKEFENVENILRQRKYRETNLDDYIKPIENISPIHEEATQNIELVVNRVPNYNVIDEDVVKTISYDDKYLKLTYKEKLFFDEVSKIVKICDNVFRVILPTIFFSYIIYIMSKE